MKHSFFLVRFPIFSIIISLLIYGLERWMPWVLIPYIWPFYLFYIILIPGIYFIAAWGSEQSGESSVQVILGSELIKTLLPLIFSALVIFKFHPEPIVFGFNFFILYILFSTFEIYCLIHNLRRSKKAEKTSKDAK